MSFLNSTLFIGALAVLGACAPSSRTVYLNSQLNESAPVAIVGGRLVPPGTALSKQVALLDKRCSATFIARNIVLTASHCFPERNQTGVIRFTDDGDISTFETRYDAVIMHPSFDPYVNSSEHDVALVRTVDPLPDGFTITSLATQMTPNKTATKAVGRGLIFYPNQLGPHAANDRKLREVDFTNLKLLKTKIGSWYSIKIGLAAGVSSGDSGGPLFAVEDGAFKQIGVASTIADDSTGDDAAYSSVVLNADWIRQASVELLKQN